MRGLNERYTPLLRLPLTFRSAATPCGRAAKARGTQLRPRYNPRHSAAVWGWLRPWFPRISVRGRWVKIIIHGNDRNPTGRALLCAANYAKKILWQKEKGERRRKIYALLRILDARPQGVAASGRSGGVARGGIRNRRCLVPPFANPGCRVGSIPSPPASGHRNGGNFRALPRGGDIFILYKSRGTRGIHRRCIPYRARRFRESR